PVLRLPYATVIISRAAFGQLSQMTSTQFCFEVGGQRRDIDVELPGNVLRSRRNVAESGIVLIKELVIETRAHNFARPLFDFADVNQHPCCWIDRPGKNEIGDVITTAPIARTRFGAESAQIFSIAPVTNAQTPGS